LFEVSQHFSHLAGSGMPVKGRGHGNETTASEWHKIATPHEIAKERGRSQTRHKSPAKEAKQKLTADESKAKRTAFAQAHHRARVLKTTSWDDELKPLKTDAVVTKVCNAVRANLKVAMKKAGGNWYVEHRHKERAREEECCRCRATYTGDGPSALNLCDHRGCMLGVHTRCLRRGESATGIFFL